MNPWTPISFVMDHRYIDEHSVAARYIDNALTATERAAFESHPVDCQDCADRILLAGMFHAQPAGEVWNQASRQVVFRETLPFRARFAARLAPWQLIVIFAITALLLLAIPALLIPVFLR